jgi:enterochelin esterase-like enzyme
MFKPVLFPLVFLSTIAVAQSPNVSSGTIKHYQDFKSKFVMPRNVDVWMPEGYDAKNKYAVLYMNDGNEMFDSTKDSDKQEWGMDETITKLLIEDKIKKCIVVAISNTGGMRHAEYFPQKPFATFSLREQDSMYQVKYFEKEPMLRAKVQSDNYLNFLVKELKPFIDKNYSTLKDASNTFIGGPSMGALISLYAVCEYPKVFGGAACMSTHWLGLLPNKNNLIVSAFNEYLKINIPSNKNHLFYFDYGNLFPDNLYKSPQILADAIFAQKGYTSQNYFSKEFVGEGHKIKSWRKRLETPLLFLLKK